MLHTNAADLPGPALISSTTEYSTARGPTPTRSPAPPAQAPAPAKADYSAFSAFGSSHSTPQTTTPQPSLFQQQQAAAATRQQVQQAPASDPFAAFASPARQSTPQQPQPSMFDLGNNHTAASPVTAAPADDDEWAFSSALPEGPPSSNTISVSETSLSISLHAVREPATPSIITMSVTFSNKAAQPISELTFMAAVTKASQI
jgi:ADP-ribosylation factor-binding protein GGA